MIFKLGAAPNCNLGQTNKNSQRHTRIQTPKHRSLALLLLHNSLDYTPASLHLRRASLQHNTAMKYS
uniref:Uncharacterized protein n=1 Tax=Setaria italica TaxID=4555 RepID=K3YF18_SETIT